MKANKKILAFIMALSCTLSSVVISADSIEEIDGYNNPTGIYSVQEGTLEDIINSYDVRTTVEYRETGTGTRALIFSEDGTYKLFNETKFKTVTMKDGTYPPFEEIDEAEGNHYHRFMRLPYIEGNVFELSIADNDMIAYDILKNDSNVLSIDERIKVYQYSFILSDIVVKSEFDEREEKEFLEKYKPLGLTREVFEYDPSLIVYSIDTDKIADSFDLVKDICEDERYMFGGEELESGSLDSFFYSSGKNIYSADSTDFIKTGDINADGEIDLTDLSELSLAIIGDKTLTKDQLKSADINDNGEADLADLARLKQYLSKVITAL